MNILEIELTPEVERQLGEKAQQRGLLASEYARAALQDFLNSPEPMHSIMELEGLGAKIWKDDNGDLIDAQKYVNELRREWDHRP